MVSVTAKMLSQKLEISFIETATILVVEANNINYLRELRQEQLLVN